MQPVTIKTGQPTGEPPRLRHMLNGCDHFYTDDAGEPLNPVELATAEQMATLRPCKDCMAASAARSRGGR